MFPVDAKILVVDDSSFARTMIKNYLRDLKYWKILEASGAEEAKTMFTDDEHIRNPVHLLISDVRMPDQSGIDLLRWVRKQERIQNIPVIMLTASQDKKEILEAGKLGVSHYMIKPFDAEILAERMSSAWAKHGEKYFAANPAKG